MIGDLMIWDFVIANGALADRENRTANLKSPITKTAIQGDFFLLLPSCRCTGL
jgi:hypothetical protein